MAAPGMSSLGKSLVLTSISRWLLFALHFAHVLNFHVKVRTHDVCFLRISGGVNLEVWDSIVEGGKIPQRI